MCDIKKSFERLMDAMFIRYKGCLIEPSKDGYWWANKRYETEQLAKDEIDWLLELIGRDQPANRLKK